MADEKGSHVGYCECPFCNREVEVKKTKKGFAYYNCKCGQHFTRSLESSEALCARTRPDKFEKEATDNGKKPDPGRSGGLTII